MRRLMWFTAGIFAGLTAAAISKELEKAPEQRTWQGTVAGVPYDLRPASVSNILRDFWNPESDKIFNPRAFGLGWSVNIAAVKRKIDDVIAAQEERRASEPEER
jgi:hypothetical protein